MSREITNPANLERLAGELYHTPLGDVGAINFGNIKMWQQDGTSDTIKGYYHPRNGTQKQVRNDLKESTVKFVVKGNERTPEIDAILLNGKIGAAFTQAASAVDATVPLVVTKRKTYDIGKFKVLGVSATVSAVTKIRGVRDNGEIVPANADYVVDYLLGKIYIPETSSIVDGTTLTVTYQCEALSGLYIKEVGQHALRKGTFELVGFEGEDLIRKRFRFDGQITPKEHGENSIENFNEFSFEITATGDVEVIILS